MTQRKVKITFLVIVGLVIIALSTYSLINNPMELREYGIISIIITLSAFGSVLITKGLGWYEKLPADIPNSDDKNI